MAASFTAQYSFFQTSTLVDGHCPGERWGAYPSPLGLSLGILASLVGQLAAVGYHWWHLTYCPDAKRIQPEPRPYSFLEGMATHFSKPGGILMIVGYLVGTWMLDLMPCSYYNMEGGVRLWMVFAQIMSQDFLMYIMHRFEHKGHALIYKLSHKPHHRFTNPRLFDAFDGSMPDTFTMILVPLFFTARLLPANVWEYMAFGASWSAWLVLIHSETEHAWDRAFRAVGLGTAADHHVHHKTFTANYGHTMMWWDHLFGTYKDPCEVKQFSKELYSK